MEMLSDSDRLDSSGYDKSKGACKQVLESPANLYSACMGKVVQMLGIPPSAQGRYPLDVTVFCIWRNAFAAPKALLLMNVSALLLYCHVFVAAPRFAIRYLQPILSRPR